MDLVKIGIECKLGDVEKGAYPAPRPGDEKGPLAVEIFDHPDLLLPGHVGDGLPHLVLGLLEKGVEELVHVVDEKLLLLVFFAVGGEGAVTVP